jgi:hypothetical protein
MIAAEEIDIPPELLDYLTVTARDPPASELQADEDRSGASTE